MPDGKNGRRFTYDSAGRDATWAQETEPWVYGWWYWGWADLALPVSHVDPDTHTITLKQNTNYGLRVGECRHLRMTVTFSSHTHAVTHKQKIKYRLCVGEYGGHLHMTVTFNCHTHAVTHKQRIEYRLCVLSLIHI